VFALRPVSLAVEQQGDTVNDPDRLAAIIGHRLDTLAGDLARAPVGLHGFNLACGQPNQYTTDIAFGISDSGGRRSKTVVVHLTCAGEPPY